MSQKKRRKREEKKKYDRDESENASLRTVGDICKKGLTMPPEEKALVAYEYFEKQKECLEMCVVDEHQNFLGLLTRTDMLHAFGGRYGYSLHQRKDIVDLAKKKTLTVLDSFSIEYVSKLAMERTAAQLYDPVVVLQKQKYYGVVTIKDLLIATVSIAVEKANESNPLTSLPGNKVIEEKINHLIESSYYFALMYLDLDNFKAYNDAYGFQNGDRMIILLSQIMQKVFGKYAFYGHIGGDDFVIITREKNVQKYAKEIIEEFSSNVRGLYNLEDCERGYIISKNRKGEEEKFPIASISIAAVTNEIRSYEYDMEKLTKQIVAAKKKAKEINGNSIVVI